MRDKIFEEHVVRLEREAMRGFSVPQTAHYYQAVHDRSWSGQFRGVKRQLASNQLPRRTRREEDTFDCHNNSIQCVLSAKSFSLNESKHGRVRKTEGLGKHGQTRLRLQQLRSIMVNPGGSGGPSQGAASKRKHAQTEVDLGEKCLALGPRT